MELITCRVTSYMKLNIGEVSHTHQKLNKTKKTHQPVKDIALKSYLLSLTVAKDKMLKSLI